MLVRILDYKIGKKNRFIYISIYYLCKRVVCHRRVTNEHSAVHSSARFMALGDIEQGRKFGSILVVENAMISSVDLSCVFRLFCENVVILILNSG